MRWTALPVLLMSALVSRGGLAQAPGAPPAAAPEPIPPPAQPAPPEPAPAQPAAISPATAPAPSAAVAPTVRVTSTAFALELGGAFDVSARFPKDDAGRQVDEAVDSAVGLGVWVGSRAALYGLTVERLGLGKDHYAANTNGETLNASYLADTLWLAGRWYFTGDRPAFYLSLAAGPALPRVRATGTRASTDALVVPPQSYECSRAGRVGAGVAFAAGTEFDLAESWSLLAEARFSGHFMSGATDAFSGCAPGTGPAVAGVLRLGLAYRFGG
jgi:hypothetical protein